VSSWGGEGITSHPDWRCATLPELLGIIRDSDREITEDVKWRCPSNRIGAPVWEHNGIVYVGNILKERVQLTFSAGAADEPEVRPGCT
jgi:hypothetical protein